MKKPKGFPREIIFEPSIIQAERARYIKAQDWQDDSFDEYQEGHYSKSKVSARTIVENEAERQAGAKQY